MNIQPQNEPACDDDFTGMGANSSGCSRWHEQFSARLPGEIQQPCELLKSAINAFNAFVDFYILGWDFTGKTGDAKTRQAHLRLDNELLYDLVINTGRVAIGDAVAVIAEGLGDSFRFCKISGMTAHCAPVDPTKKRLPDVWKTRRWPEKGDWDASGFTRQSPGLSFRACIAQARIDGLGGIPDSSLHF